MAKINKIKLSGTSYDLQDSNATKVVSLTQSEYDALVTKDANTLYNITDAQSADLSNYYTKSQTSGATEISTALGGKQDTLVSGTNIKTINNESILGNGNITIEGGGGGGKAIEAGRGITVTTGETADTISFNLPLSAGTHTGSLIIGENGHSDYESTATAIGAIVFPSRYLYGKNYARGESSFAHGSGCSAETPCTHAEGNNTKANGFVSHAEGDNTVASGQASHAEGSYCSANTNFSHAEGVYTKTSNAGEHSEGRYNISSMASYNYGDSGNTLMSVGNGNNTTQRHNAFEIRENGDIYIADTNDTSTSNFYQKPMIKLQDALGGEIDTAITSGSSNAVTSAAIFNQLGGLKFVKLSQSEYNALQTKDENTLYIISNESCGQAVDAYVTVDDNFSNWNNKVYVVDFSNLGNITQGDEFGNVTASINLYLTQNDFNPTYIIDATHNINIIGGDYLQISDTASTIVYSQNSLNPVDLCNLFNKGFYLLQGDVPFVNECLNEECFDWDCLEWDEESGECIEQGDCIYSECIEENTIYVMRVKQ